MNTGIFWFDVETTGLDPVKNSIIQIGGVIEINGNIETEFQYTCRPIEGRLIEAKALEISGVTEKEIMAYEKPEKVYWSLSNMLSIYRRVALARLVPAGYNVDFDLQFLQSFWKAHTKRSIWYDYLTHNKVDILAVVRYLKFTGMAFTDMENCKLSTVGKYLGIGTDLQHNAHDDALLTMKISKHLNSVLLPGADIRGAQEEAHGA